MTAVARRRARLLPVALTAAMAALLLGGCTTAAPVDSGIDAARPAATREAPLESTATPSPSTPSASPSPEASTSGTAEGTAEAAAEGTAQAAALALAVKGRAPSTGYSREQFGSGWVDVDRNGCDTRNDMLRLRLTDLDTEGSCTVLAGTLADPFTATTIRFVKGGASEVDIDHLVALSDAWQKGAAQWEFAQRVAFANDPLNLEPVDAGANRQKGDGDAATWLPPNKDFRCQYVARQVAVKTKYGVWVTQAELDAILRVLDSCPGEPLPGPGDQPIVASNTGGPPPTEPAPAPTEASEPAPEQPATDPDMGTCKAAKAAGYGPYVQGQDPEYAWYRDADKDGVVCE